VDYPVFLYFGGLWPQGPLGVQSLSDCCELSYLPYKLFSCSTKVVGSGHLIWAGFCFFPIIVLSPCQASLAFPVVNCCSTLFLLWILANLDFCLNSFSNSFTFCLSPLRNASFVLFRHIFRSFVTQGLLLGYNLTCLDRMTESAQKVK